MYRAKTNLISLILRALLFALLAGIILGYLFGYRYILVNGRSSEPYIHYQSLILTSPTKLQNLKVGDFITYTSSKQAIFAKQSNVTHQIIAIKYDGSYFSIGEKFTALFDGVEKTMIYGYDLDEQGNVKLNVKSEKPGNVKTTVSYSIDFSKNELLKSTMVTIYDNNDEIQSESTEVEKSDASTITIQQNGNITDDANNVIGIANTNLSKTCNIITMQRQNAKASFDLSKEYKNFDQVVGKVVGQSVILGKTIFLIMGNPLILVGFLGCFVLLFVLKEQFSADNLRIYK